MEIHHSSASAMHIPGQGHHHLDHHVLDRQSTTGSHTSPSSSSHTRDPMAIPGARTEEPPPPLPPPRYNEELERGIDAAWAWQNRDSAAGGQGSSISSSISSSMTAVKPNSSLYGGYLQPRAHTPFCCEPEEMELDDWARRNSAVLAFRAPSHTATATSSLQQIGPGTPTTNVSSLGLARRRPSPTPSGQRLHGERPLAQQNFSRSSQAYDQQLLSKIGKPSSPPRHSPSDSSDSSHLAHSSHHLAHKLSLQTRDCRPSTDLPAISPDCMQPRWVPSPASGALSPSARPNWRDHLDHRSPSHDCTSPSLLLDPELFVPGRTSGKPVRTSSKPVNHDDYSSPTSVSHRGSYDHGAPSSAGLDPDFPGEEGTASTRRFYFNVQPHHSDTKPSRQGMKRRAPSPPAEVARDDKARAYPTDPSYATVAATAAASTATASSASLSRSPATTQTHSSPAYGSVSSTASSSRLYSPYPSSFAPSIAGSSLTSASSLERQSPPDISQPPPPLSASSHLVASPVDSSAMPPRKPSVPSPSESADASRKMSIQSAINDPTPPPQPASAPALRAGAHFMCDCCPKKPRKFATEDELRAHQMEKQYSCQYCNNRFKNKNEAERHQNSLHLRRHSWSCAAIPSYQAAFHPSSSTNPAALAAASSDACGFCGQEFPNHPQPDWERRIAHLTNLHKFGECNQTKKFYRADHFRQHLKHSHSGQSGKWTNMLESVCLREEQPAEAVSVSPAAETDAVRRSITTTESPKDHS